MEKETSEIVKLTERISKDPKSKLFVPLAEEYKRTGDIEMAVYVLTEGLKNNPGYVTARSILGRLLFELGDLAGSQKELEEVVRAIPDNLLAQRKLGDICILQNKPNEALGHYKSVLSLNPRDHEIASMISDIEAGRDVTSKIPQPKAQPSPAVIVKEVIPETKQQPQISPAQQAPATARETLGSPAEAVKAEKISDSASPPPAAEKKEEEPEEVIAVEPLEQESPEQESTAVSVDFLSEQSQGEMQTPATEAPAELSFTSTEQVGEEQRESDQFVVEPAILEKETPEEIQPVAAEGLIKAEIAETEIQEEAPAKLPVNVPEEAQEKTDDFTTDTLAELYIAQGFYEKAIDIYERMLVDKPNSRGLKDKLDRVKSMAAASADTATAYTAKEQGSADIFAEPEVYRARKEPTGEKKEADLFTEPRERTPAPAHSEPPTAERDDRTDKFTPPASLELPGAKPLYTDFEPREYIPPQEEPPKTKEEPMEAIAEKAHAVTKSPQVSRKETIDRLETWLRNIKKEK